jgi:hypothetical protein
MFGTILGSMIYILAFAIGWMGGVRAFDNGWIGIAIVAGGIVGTWISIKSMLNDMEEKRKVK